MLSVRSRSRMNESWTEPPDSPSGGRIPSCHAGVSHGAPVPRSLHQCERLRLSEGTGQMIGRVSIGRPIAPRHTRPLECQLIPPDCGWLRTREQTLPSVRMRYRYISSPGGTPLSTARMTQRIGQRESAGTALDFGSEDMRSVQSQSRFRLQHALQELLDGEPGHRRGRVIAHRLLLVGQRGGSRALPVDCCV